MKAARITGGARDLAEVTAYMPGNYNAAEGNCGAIFVVGEDVAGWTLEDYVIPRLASGGIFAEKVLDI